MSLSSPRFQTFSDVDRFLDQLGLFHMDLSLVRMHCFAESWNSELPVVHVVGTNGKGSTSVFFESMARMHGLSTGLSTSPHFLTVRERMRVNGCMLSEEAWVRAANALAGQCPDLDLTYFEWLTCLGALAFAEAGVEVAVMEAGLGGRYDATRVFSPQLVLLSSVGLDHEAYLGSTLAQVADDKCRAIAPGCVAVSAPQEPAVMAVYERRAEAVGAVLKVAEPAQGMELGLAGDYQAVNAGLALEGWRQWCVLSGRAVDEDACREGLARAWMPGRFQVMAEGVTGQGGPSIILDGAHNGHGLRALARALEQENLVPDAVIFGCMRDKDLEEVRPALARLEAPLLIATGIPGNKRILAPADLARALEPSLERRCGVAEDMAQALEVAAGSGAKTILVCGSLYLLAEFYKLHPGSLNACS